MSEPAEQAGSRRDGAQFLFWRGLLILGIVVGGIFLHSEIGAEPLDPEQVRSTNITMLLVLFFGLLIGSGIVSSTETALFSLDKLDQSKMRGSTHWIDHAVIRLLNQANDTLVTILILNNFINIAASLAAAALMETLLRGAGAGAFILAAFMATTGILLFGEIMPKILAHMNPPAASRVLAPPLLVAAWLLKWPRSLMGIFLRQLLRWLKVPDPEPQVDVSEEELKVMFSSGEVSQVLEEDEREMIDGVFDLRRTEVAEIMTPRMSVAAVPDDLDQETMVERLREFANNRVLVYHESLDELVGFVLVKEILLDAQGEWRNHLREPVCVPERMGLLDLLKTFRRRRTKMAVVVDEYGGVAGIVTLQDLLEEIVGDIYERHEQSQVDIETISEEQWRVRGSVSLSHLADELEVTLPEELGRTVGGLVMNSLGRIPDVGDEITYDGLHFQVEEMVGRRVQSLLIHRVPTASVGAGDSEGGS